MPLQKRKCSTKKCLQKAVSANIKELYHNGTRKRSMKQMIAIGYAAASKK